MGPRVKDIQRAAQDTVDKLFDARQREDDTKHKASAKRVALDALQAQWMSLDVDAPSATRDALRRAIFDCEAELHALEMDLVDVQREIGRLDDTRKQVASDARVYLEETQAAIAKTHMMNATSVYGRNAIAQMANTLKENEARSFQILALLGMPNGGAAGVGAGSISGPQRTVMMQSYLQGYANDLAIASSLDEGTPADARAAVAFVMETYAQEAVMAQSLTGGDIEDFDEVTDGLRATFQQSSAAALFEKSSGAPQASAGDSPLNGPLDPYEEGTIFALDYVEAMRKDAHFKGETLVKTRDGRNTSPADPMDTSAIIDRIEQLDIHWEEANQYAYELLEMHPDNQAALVQVRRELEAVKKVYGEQRAVLTDMLERTE